MEVRVNYTLKPEIAPSTAYISQEDLPVEAGSGQDVRLHGVELNARNAVPTLQKSRLLFY